jgi:predicted nucleic acid-binding protein
MHKRLPPCNKNHGNEFGKEPVFRYFPVFLAGPDHLEILRGLLGKPVTSDNLVTDAHLAALAIETRCRIGFV